MQDPTNPETPQAAEARALIERATAPGATWEGRERFYEASERAGSIRSQGPVVADPARQRLHDAAPRMLAALQVVCGKITKDVMDFLGPSGTLHVPLKRTEIDAIRQAVAEATGEVSGGN